MLVMLVRSATPRPPSKPDAECEKPPENYGVGHANAVLWVRLFSPWVAFGGGEEKNGYAWTVD